MCDCLYCVQFALLHWIKQKKNRNVHHPPYILHLICSHYFGYTPLLINRNTYKCTHIGARIEMISRQCCVRCAFPENLVRQNYISLFVYFFLFIFYPLVANSTKYIFIFAMLLPMAFFPSAWYLLQLMVAVAARSFILFGTAPHFFFD